MADMDYNTRGGLSVDRNSLHQSDLRLAQLSRFRPAIRFPKQRKTTLRKPRQCSASKRFGKLGCALLMATSTAHAEDYPVHPVTTMTSAPGESEPAFLSRVGHALRAYSGRTRLEACGEIATDGSRYGVAITTSGSHIGCAIDSVILPPGMQDTGETIHSHGGMGSFNANRADLLFLGDRAITGALVTVHGQDLYHFSPIDLAGPHGYLATPSGLIHH
ncbi:MAG: hypothetical protein KGO96_14125 [Elusimicrobia bacterium]|nr:hypothetical protein [Elusimicrobiota bacterium]